MILSVVQALVQYYIKGHRHGLEAIYTECHTIIKQHLHTLTSALPHSAVAGPKIDIDRNIDRQIHIDKGETQLGGQLLHESSRTCPIPGEGSGVSGGVAKTKSITAYNEPIT